MHTQIAPIINDYDKGILKMTDFLVNTFFILLATISPGPDFAIVSRNAIRYNQKAGVVTALGIAAGTIFHAIYCILGLAVILSKSVLLFSLIKYIGALYLIFLGLKGLFSKEEANRNKEEKPTKKSIFTQSFWEGLLCTTLNPKSILFFIAFFTMIIKPSMPMMIQVGYVVEMLIIDLVWYSLVAYFFSHQKMQKILGSCLHYVQKFFGGFLVYVGLKIATF